MLTDEQQLAIWDSTALCDDRVLAFARAIEQAVNAAAQMPVGWFESPHGAFRVNPLWKPELPPQTLQWQIPVYLNAAAENAAPDVQAAAEKWSNEPWDGRWARLRIERLEFENTRLRELLRNTPTEHVNTLQRIKES